MNLLQTIRRHVTSALNQLGYDTASLAETVRPAADAKFGDYQVNCAMQLGKSLGKPPREVAQNIVNALQKNGEFLKLCHPPEIAGPGFINLKLHDEQLAALVQNVVKVAQLGVPKTDKPKTFVIDYSGPNVAKPMHVGHIRSTVIGDALARILRFLGHKVIGDNHIGDWGTQFGMIIYGYKHFRDEAALKAEPVEELARLYRLVRQLVDYNDAVKGLPEKKGEIARRENLLKDLQNNTPADPKEAKKHAKNISQQQNSLKEAREELESVEKKIASVRDNPALVKLVEAHPTINDAVLKETAKLHENDPENVKLWKEFLPACRAEIDHIYDRLGIKFDEQLGESFYHDRLGNVVKEFAEREIATTSNGATVIFLDGFETPFLIRKQDGAFLYATSDLATIQYRLEKWNPDAILYVVDHRQGLHFEQLFAAARKCWGLENVELKHIKFGTVLGDDGKPFKTRSGDTVGLEGLLDEAITRAHALVSENDDKKKDGPQFSADERNEIAKRVGLGAIKYADLSQNRESDYTFSYDKMLALIGNTAAYMQYAYARVNGIFEKNDGAAKLKSSAVTECSLMHPAERALAITCLRFAEALDLVVSDYRPNQLAAYLYELASQFSSFYDACSVIDAKTPAELHTRLTLCALTARIIKQGLNLLGIETVERM